MADIDKEIKKIEAGNAWDERDEVVQVEVKKTLDKVIPVRLSGDKWEELRREARELGIGPTTLARMWLLERLRQRMRRETKVASKPLNVQITNDQMFQEAQRPKTNHWEGLHGKPPIIPFELKEKPVGGKKKPLPTKPRAAQYRP